MVEEYPVLTAEQKRVLDEYGTVGIAPCAGMSVEEAIGHIRVNHKSLNVVLAEKE